jgi:microcystin-dependent protein
MANLSTILKRNTAGLITSDGIADGAVTIPKLATSLGYVPPGAIIAYAKNATPPGGWLICNGANNVSRSVYNALFGVIGTTYGDGDGLTTFQIPDLRNNFIRGYGTSAQESVTDVGTATSGSATITALDRNLLATIRVGYVVTSCTVTGLVGSLVTAIDKTKLSVTLSVISTTTAVTCSVTFQRSFGGLESPYAGYNIFTAYADDGDSQTGSFGAINDLNVNGVDIIRYPKLNSSSGAITVPTIADDTRPVNIAMHYCIKY